MRLISASLAFLAASTVAQKFEIEYGNTHITRLMSQLEIARKSGDQTLINDLNAKLERAQQGGDSSWNNYETKCHVSAYFDAEIFAVDIMKPPTEVAWAIDRLDKFWRTDSGGDMPYPGDFDRFMHPDGFRVIKVDYEELPEKVKAWRDDQMIKGTEERKYIANVDGVAFFAPGVVTWLLPLFAGKDVEVGKDACEETDELVNLDNYHKRSQNAEPDTKFLVDYVGRSQVGNSIRIKTVAEKRVKVKADEQGEL
ncbi:uncharacterized protein BDR25DRAFT_209892 [Lindgomyces ingoldianus]|uniref:Uncharacterized protein n=1 Tax=Lindgomyces ingoldianus TaxID=673940 RepID=A0ACB6RBK4_9PLEO|nr:uncharacterized protein BDR25DRAFT_209892 [Lindgomyces ingoldianus]KAF2476668.1 hypothetical protein BDR25DRAFT_209892 [Lindgomyces ingoldianus]